MAASVGGGVAIDVAHSQLTDNPMTPKDMINSFARNSIGIDSTKFNGDFWHDVVVIGQGVGSKIPKVGFAFGAPSIPGFQRLRNYLVEIYGTQRTRR